MALIRDLKEAKLFPYLSGSLVKYQEWHHTATSSGISERKYITGIVTDVRYKALGNGKLIYAILYISSGLGISRVHHDQISLRVLQLADGTSFREDSVLSTSHLARVLTKLWHADQKRLLSGH